METVIIPVQGDVQHITAELKERRCLFGQPVLFKEIRFGTFGNSGVCNS